MPKFNKPNQTKSVAAPKQAPLIKEPRCHVCASPHRVLVDQMLVAGVTFSEIERNFAFAGISRKSIASHKEKHLGHEEAAIRAVIEKEAAAAQRNFEEGIGRVLTKKAYLDVALQKAFDALIKDEIPVEPKDAVKVIELLQKLETEAEGVAVDEMRAQFQMFLQAVREVVPEELWKDIVERMKDLLRASGREADFGDEPAQLEPADAEVVSP